MRLRFISKFQVVSVFNYEKSLLDTDSNVSIFGGYYGSTQISSEGNVLIYEVGDSFTGVKVICASGETIYSLATDGHNFQDACRYFWLDSQNFIYTHISENRLVSSQVNYLTGLHSYCSYEISAVTANRTFVSVNTESYHYFGSEYAILMSKIKPYEDQILLRTVDERHKLIRSWCLADIRKLCSIQHNEIILQHTFVYENKVLLFARSKSNKSRNNYILLLDTENQKLEKLIEGEKLSHVCWIDIDQFIFYDSSKKRGYYLYSLKNNTTAYLDMKTSLKLSDGHPVIVGNWLITDTYATIFGANYLYAVNMSTLEAKILCRIKPPFQSRLLNRCDLHPKYCQLTDSLYFDYLINQRRRIAKIFNVSDNLK